MTYKRRLPYLEEPLNGHQDDSVSGTPAHSICKPKEFEHGEVQRRRQQSLRKRMYDPEQDADAQMLQNIRHWKGDPRCPTSHPSKSGARRLTKLLGHFGF